MRSAATSAGRVEVIAPGTGDSIAPSGTGTPVVPAGKTLMPTRQVTVGFIRPKTTVYVTWHMPESAHDQLASEIDATLQSIRFSDDVNRSRNKY